MEQKTISLFEASKPCSPLTTSFLIFNFVCTNFLKFSVPYNNCATSRSQYPSAQRRNLPNNVRIGASSSPWRSRSFSSRRSLRQDARVLSPRSRAHDSEQTRWEALRRGYKHIPWQSNQRVQLRDKRSISRWKIWHRRCRLLHRWSIKVRRRDCRGSSRSLGPWLASHLFGIIYKQRRLWVLSRKFNSSYNNLKIQRERKSSRVLLGTR